MLDRLNHAWAQGRNRLSTCAACWPCRHSVRRDEGAIDGRAWLRAHKWSNVRQLEAVSRKLLTRLWAAGAGPADLSAQLTIDPDSTIVEVHGRAEQGAAFCYTKVRGYHSGDVCADRPPAGQPITRCCSSR